MTIKIEPNIPIPLPKYGPTKTTYPWSEMKVGDSFELPAEPKAKRSLMYKLHTAASHRARRHEEKYVLRTTKVGVRVWRKK